MHVKMNVAVVQDLKMGNQSGIRCVFKCLRGEVRLTGRMSDFFMCELNWRKDYFFLQNIIFKVDFISRY